MMMMTMMLLKMTSVLFIFFIFSTAIDAKTQESLEVKVFNPNFKIPDQQMLDLLKKADLESHGYKKEITTKLVSEPGFDKPIYQKSYFYYKEVNCSRLREIDQELQTLMPGIFGVELVTKISQEIKTKNLTSMKRCKVGLEVHFKEAEGCSDANNKSRRRRKRGCNWCGGCWSSQLYS